MDWTDHANNFKAEWVIRYVSPGEAAWKTLWDGFILKNKSGTKTKYPEGRAIVLMNLSTREKASILSNFPKNATYIKECFRQFWKLKLKPKTTSFEGVISESPWHGHKYLADTDNNFRAYCKNVLHITQFSDFWNRDTNRPFTRGEWRRWVEQLHRAWYGVDPTNEQIIDNADKIYDIQQKIPRPILVQLLRRTTAIPKINMKVYLMRANISWPAIIISPTQAQRVRIDAVGRHHLLNRFVQHRFYNIIAASKWKTKWAGPKGQSYATDVEWDFHGTKNIADISISVMTTRKAKAKMKPPAAEKKWADKLNFQIDWKKTWGLKTTFATPRDKAPIMFYETPKKKPMGSEEWRMR